MLAFSEVARVVVDYDAFGNLIARTGSTPNSYLFTSEQFDSDLGLCYLRARYHNPDTGRFWTQDLFAGFGEDPTSLHKYTYCGNNPVNAFDPSGSYTITELAVAQGIGGLVGAGFGFYDAWRRTDSVWEGLKGAATGAVWGAALGPLIPYLPMLMMGPAGQMTLLMYGTMAGASATLDAEKYPDLAAIQIIGAFVPFLMNSRQASILADEYYGAPSGRVSGRRTIMNAADDFETKRSLIRENHSADVLANNGYDVEQNPSIPGTTKKPDYNLRRYGDPNEPYVTYDNYAPASGTSVRSIWRTVERKIQSGQAEGAVINLNDSNVSFAELQAQFSQWPIPGLKGVLVIRGRTVSQLKL